MASCCRPRSIFNTFLILEFIIYENSCCLSRKQSFSAWLRENTQLRKLTNFAHSSDYTSWFHSYLAYKQSSVHISKTLSFPYVVKSYIPEGSTSGPLHLNKFIHNICDYIFNSNYLLFAVDMKIYLIINNVFDCKLLEYDNSVQSWCFENCTFLNVGRSTVISLKRKTIHTTFIINTATALSYASAMLW